MVCSVDRSFVKINIWLVKNTHFIVWSNLISNYIAVRMICVFDSNSHIYFIQYFFIMAQQPLSRHTCTSSGFGFQGLFYTHCRIVRPTYGGTVHSGLEPMKGMLLTRTSWRVFHETGHLILVFEQLRESCRFELRIGSHPRPFMYTSLSILN